MIRTGRRAAARLLRSSMVNGALRLLARARGNSLVLVYHRLGPAASPACQIVPTIPGNLFRAQLQALGEVVDLLSLDEILAMNRAAAATHRRPAVAVTFDDDLLTHVSEALPILLELRVPATFFLSGRALHGRGPYWFQRLEQLLIRFGQRRTAELLGVRASLQTGSLTRLCEQDESLRRRVGELAGQAPEAAILPVDGISTLAAAGMTIGFHTVDHESLRGMGADHLDSAVSCGRNQLAAVAGTPVRYFAYPHGKADALAAMAVRRAGFDAAFTGHPKPLRRNDERYHLGRWEPGPLEVDDLLSKLPVRLLRAAPQLFVLPQSCT